MIILEYLLIILLLLTALMAVHFEDELISIICLSVFSGTLSTLYILYKAPDVALTEVVIGTGLITALFMAAISQLRSGEEDHYGADE